MDFLEDRVVPWVLRNRSFSGWMALIVAGTLFVLLPIGVFFILCFVALIGVVALLLMGRNAQDRQEYRRMDRSLEDSHPTEPVRLPERRQPERLAVPSPDPVPEDVVASWQAAHDARLNALAVSPIQALPGDRPAEADSVPVPAPAVVPESPDFSDDPAVIEVAPPVIVTDIPSQPIPSDPVAITSERGESAFRQTTYRTVPTIPIARDDRTLTDLASEPAETFRDDCAEVLRRLGYARVRHEATAPPFTPDLVGEDDLGRRTVVRCRQDDPAVTLDSATIQAFIDAKNARHRLERGVLITIGQFDPSAFRLARQHDLALIDGGDLSAALGLVGYR